MLYLTISRYASYARSKNAILVIYASGQINIHYDKGCADLFSFVRNMKFKRIEYTKATLTILLSGILC